jgi:predicted TIM-barrel fold metal-dependent hydrolase
VPILDVHCYLGGSVVPGVGHDGPSVLEAMRERGVQSAIAISTHAMAVDVAAGNRIVRAAIDKVPDLYGCLVARTNRVEESVASLRELAGHRKVLGMLLIGRHSGDPVGKAAADEVLNAYRRFGKPVFLLTPHGECADAALEIARGYGMLKVILLGMGGDDWRRGIAVADAATNVLVETSGSPDGAKLPAAVEALGVHRVVFGSGFPHVDPAVGLAALDAAGLSVEARRRIAGENARRVFELAA